VNAFVPKALGPIAAADRQSFFSHRAPADLSGTGMIPGIPAWLLPLRLAWRQLRAEPSRLLAAVAGVMFASILVLMQLGFRGALFDTAIALPQALRGELFLIHPLTTALFRAEPLPRVRAFQALSVPDVEQVAPVYLARLE
jgi:putative ABC transport system permease protein